MIVDGKHTETRQDSESGTGFARITKVTFVASSTFLAQFRFSISPFHYFGYVFEACISHLGDVSLREPAVRCDNASSRASVSLMRSQDEERREVKGRQVIRKP